MYTKLICALLISTLLFSCDRNEKKLSVNDLAMSPVEKSPRDKNSNETDQKIPVATELVTVTDTTTALPPQSRQQSTIKTPPAVNINSDWNKKIIKTAGIKIEVKNFKNYNDFLYSKVKQYGGYIAQEDNNLTDEKSETVVSIKVPVQLFDGLISDLTNTDNTILEKSIKSEDVTGEAVDTKSRLEAKKQMRLKYLDFLKESKNMGEILQVQNEINNIQEEIESAAGRFASLTNQAAYSTINLTFFQPSAGFKPSDKAPGFFTKTAAAFKTGADWVSDLFIALISIWPLLAVGGIVFFVYKKRKTAKPVPQNV